MRKRATAYAAGVRDFRYRFSLSDFFSLFHFGVDTSVCAKKNIKNKIEREILVVEICINESQKCVCVRGCVVV